MKAADEVVAARKALCRACPHAVLGGKQKFLIQCQKCGCVLAALVRFTRATCPIGKW